MNIARRATGTLVLAAILAVAATACDGDARLTDTDPSNAEMPGSDTEPPALVSADFLPKRVDVTQENQLVEIFADLRDAESGIVLATAQFKGPSTAQITQFTELHRVEGDPQEGRWEGAIVVPQGAEGGTWTLMFIRADDEAGNRIAWDTEELRAMGIPVELEVVPK